MASSEESSRKKALMDEDPESPSGSDADPNDAAGLEGLHQGNAYSGKTELEDATQVAGRPIFTSDDPTGFGETTQALRLERAQTPSSAGDFDAEPTRVAALSDWNPGTTAEDETRPGARGGTANLHLDAESGFSSTGASGSFGLPPPVESGDTAPAGSLPDFGTQTLPTYDFGVPTAAPSETAHGPAGGQADPNAGAIPAHLQLPNMDFTLPQLPDMGEAPPPGDYSASDLPAHLQLPTFPDLGLGAPGSGAPDAPTDPSQGVEGPPGVPPRRKTGDAPPPRRSTEVDAPAPTAFGMPEDLSLPDFAPPPSKRNLTLISMPQDSADDAPPRVIWPFVVIAVLAVSTALGVWQKDHLLALLVPKKKPPVPVVAAPTPQEQAKQAFAAGVHAYSSKEYPKAIEAFEKAASLDTGMADAQRSLGIVYATTHEQAKAVDHYKKYLELMPKAADAPAVQKIVDDYAKAQAKPATPPPEEPDKTKQKGKKAKGKRR